MTIDKNAQRDDVT